MENSKLLNMINLLKLIQTNFLQELKTFKNYENEKKHKNEKSYNFGKENKIEELTLLDFKTYYKATAIETLRYINVPVDTQKHVTELAAQKQDGTLW